MAECLEIINNNSKVDRHPAYQYTSVDENNKITCDMCGHIFPSDHAGNIKKHIQNRHKNAYRDLAKLLEEHNRPPKESDTVGNNKNQRCRSGKNIEQIFTVQHDIADIKMGLVEMCSVNMCAFRLLKNSGFSRIMAPIIKAARKCKLALSTQPEALHEYSNSEFSKMKDIIKRELNGIFFS